MKTIVKTLVALSALTFVAGCTAQAADPPATTQGWGPGWRHEQMVKALKDGTFTPGQGPGFMRGGPWGGGNNFGPGYGRGAMAAAIGPDGKVDVTRLPEGCPMRQALTQ